MDQPEEKGRKGRGNQIKKEGGVQRNFTKPSYIMGETDGGKGRNSEKGEKVLRKELPFLLLLPYLAKTSGGREEHAFRRRGRENRLLEFFQYLFAANGKERNRGEKKKRRSRS